jgi:hypothetical protein
MTIIKNATPIFSRFISWFVYHLEEEEEENDDDDD